MLIRCLALLPVLALFVGMPFLNRVEPFVLGLPLPLAWSTGCAMLTAMVLAVVYVLDPANRRS